MLNDDSSFKDDLQRITLDLESGFIMRAHLISHSCPFWEKYIFQNFLLCKNVLQKLWKCVLKRFNQIKIDLESTKYVLSLWKLLKIFLGL